MARGGLWGVLVGMTSTPLLLGPAPRLPVANVRLNAVWAPLSVRSVASAPFHCRPESTCHRYLIACCSDHDCVDGVARVCFRCSPKFALLHKDSPTHSLDIHLLWQRVLGSLALQVKGYLFWVICEVPFRLQRRQKLDTGTRPL